MLLGATQQDISSNARLLEYPYAAPVLQVANKPIFRASGWEPRRRLYDVPAKGNAADPYRSEISSRSRAKREVRDIAMCNRFTYFFTWTLDPTLIDRYSVEEVRKKVLTWLRNAAARKGFRYVAIAERHKDGAIHFHGLCNLGDVRLRRGINEKTGKLLYTDSEQPIFNMLDWKFGFSTCIPIDDNYERTCNYLTKYFEKDFSKIFGKYYFASRNLVRKPARTLIDGGIPFDEFVTENPDAYNVPIYGDVRIAGKRLVSEESGVSL